MAHVGLDHTWVNTRTYLDDILPQIEKRRAAWREPVIVHLILNDLDDLRGALKPDAQGQSWRGDLAALQRRMAGRP